jgi:hypothetical protein
MKSVRLDPDLEASLRAAAKAARMSESEFIRQAVAERSRQVLSVDSDERYAGIIGAVRSKGGQARDAHRRYAELLTEDKFRGEKLRRRKRAS